MKKELWRPFFHFAPEKGWMNDPNGLVWFKGSYHLFFQYNPYHCSWDSMHWGHAVSGDLLHWRQVDCALVPDEKYDKDPTGGCFSGSPVVWEDKLYLVYTASAKKDGKTVQTQCAAVSEDGYHFEKVKENPLVEEPFGNTENFRDPKVIRADGRWRMVCGGSSGNADDPAASGRIYLYSSDDLLRWEYNGILLESEGRWGSMFECPDLFSIGGKWILTASPMNHPDMWPTICFEGRVDFEGCQFQVDKIRRYDWGNRFYAPQTYGLPDGRRVLLGWLNGWMWMPWMEAWGPTDQEDWRGCLSLPRELFLDESGRLCQRPAKEAAALCEHTEARGSILAGPIPQKLPAGNKNACCIRLSIKREGSRQLKLILMADEQGNGTELTFDLDGHFLAADKNRMGNKWDRGLTVCTFERRERDTKHAPLTAEIWIDRSTIEVFLDGGRYVLTDTAYPSDGQCNVYVQSPYKQIPLDYEIGFIPQ